MKKIMLLSTIALSMLSCVSSDDSDNTLNPSGNPSSQNTILPIKITVDGEVLNINYNGTKILNIIGNGGTKIEFTYSGDLITGIKSYDNNVLESSVDYSYSNNLLISQIEKSYNGNGTIDTAINYTYQHISSSIINVKKQVNYGTATNTNFTLNGSFTVSNGNTLNYNASGTGTSNGSAANYTETGTCTYTDKNYPFKNVKGFDKLILTCDDGLSLVFSGIKNNLNTFKTEVASSYSGGSSLGYSAYKFNTTFNSNGYPVNESRQSTDLNGVPDSSQPEVFIYEYNQ